ncbi:hypothetical protein Tco_1248700 [Tanacetum coccineum]
MLCYLARMEPYYLKCIKDGPFQPKTTKGDAKPEAKSTESLSQTYTRYKTLLNELANDGVNLSKHKINVGFVNSLPEKWLTFSQGLRNANRTQTFNLADIYGSTPISTAFFSNNVIQDFQENSDDEVDERTIAETFDGDEEEVSNEEEVTQVKVLMALADDELTVGKSHARNGEWFDITMRKVNTHLSMNEDADWQNYLKYINIDLKFVEEQRLNLLSKYNKMVFELNKCRDELLILKQAKLDAGASPSLGTVTVSESEPTTHSVPTEVKDTEQESKINELTKLVQMLIDEKVNSAQKTQESNTQIQQTESSKSADS